MKSALCRSLAAVIICLSVSYAQSIDSSSAAPAPADSLSSAAQAPDTNAASPPEAAPNLAAAALPAPAGPHTIAVLALKNAEGVSASEASLITDRLNVELFRTGEVTLLEREQISDILKEQGFQSSGACADEACLVEMGQVLGVQDIVAGSIGRLGTLIMLNLRRIDVTSGRVEKVVSEDVSGQLEAVIGRLPNIARRLVGLEALAVSETAVPASPKKDTVRVAPDSLPPARNAAMLVLSSTPAGASIQLNGRIVGTTPWRSNTLVPGRYSLKISLPRYEDCIESFDLSAGFTKTLNQTLQYRSALLTVQSSPAGAALSLNGRRVGNTPWHNDTLAPGLYDLRLDLADHRPVTARITAVKGTRDTVNYRLFSKSEGDSVSAARRHMNAPKRWARRIVFGTIAAGALGTGIAFNAQMQKDLDREKAAKLLYERSNRSTAEYTEQYGIYEDAHNGAVDKRLVRNILYGVAGGFGFFFTLSLPF